MQQVVKEIEVHQQENSQQQKYRLLFCKSILSEGLIESVLRAVLPW